MLKKGSEIEVEIQHINIAGKGIAKVDGINVAVDRVFPGDKVLIKIKKSKKAYAEGEVIKLIEQSKLRIPTKSRHAAISGGSPWEAISYPTQLEFKQKEVERILHNVGLTPDIKQIIGMDNPWCYRNKMQYSFGYDVNMEPVLGLHVAGRKYDCYDVEECLLCENWLSQLLGFIRHETIRKGIPPYRFKTGEGVLRDLTVRVGKRTGEAMVILSVAEPIDEQIIHRAAKHFPNVTSWYTELVTVEKGRRTTRTLKLIDGEEVIHEELCGMTFPIGPQSFFQPNTEQAEKIYKIVADMAGLTGEEVVYDLFCGTGTIGLTLASKAGHVYGIDIEEEAIKMANSHGIENATYIAGDVFKTKIEWPRADVVIVDPPRAGLQPKLINWIKSLNPRKIIYLSCNLKSFARDCQEFGNLTTVQPVDQFPHTRHLELVGLIDTSTRLI